MQCGWISKALCWVKEASAYKVTYSAIQMTPFMWHSQKEPQNYSDGEETIDCWGAVGGERVWLQRGNKREFFMVMKLYYYAYGGKKSNLFYDKS